MKPLIEAIGKYEALIDEFARHSGRHFGAIGDPMLEGVRFYTFDRLSGTFNNDDAVELATDKVDEIETFLMQAGPGCTLLYPIFSKLRAVAQGFNANGKAVFLGSCGMGPGEIAWMIRRMNDRVTFEQYLHSAGISEQIVDAYNEAFEKDLNRAEQTFSAML